MFLPDNFKAVVLTALREDQAAEDITSRFSVPAANTGKAVILAKEQGVLCGIDIAAYAFRSLSRKLIFRPFKKDGDFFLKEDRIAVIEGPLRPILGAERTALNFLAFLSGVSTITRVFADAASCGTAIVMDTRKTTPGLRILQKYAVKVGGGYSHRLSLKKGIILKDNHLRASGCMHKGQINPQRIKKIISEFRKKTKKPVEVEVENLKEFMLVAGCNPDIIMLDNFILKDIRRAVFLRDNRFPRLKLEASGGISLKNIRPAAKSGVDFISIGRLTHSAPAVDFSLELSDG